MLQGRLQATFPAQAVPKQGRSGDAPSPLKGAASSASPPHRQPSPPWTPAPAPKPGQTAPKTTVALGFPLPNPCLGSCRRSGVPRSSPSPNPPPARARLMKAGRPVPISQGASLTREPRGLPRALCLAPGPALAEQRARAVWGRPGTRGDAQSLPRPRQRGRHRCGVATGTASLAASRMR